MKTRKNRTFYFTLALTIAMAFVLAACGQSNTEGTQNDTGAEGTHELSGKKIALIMRQNLGTFSAQYIEGVKQQVEAFGGELTVLDSNGDLAKMASNLDSAVTQHFDGILLDHGTKEALQQGVDKAIAQNIPIASFDTGVEGEGVVELAQNDQKMAYDTLERLAEDLNNEGNIVKILVTGFAPMDRRNETYLQFLENNPEIHEIANFGAATQNTALDTQAQMEAILKQYPEGEIDAVWAAWDEFAKGAARAIQQAGRDEIKVYGIDISDEDLQMIQDETNPWIATSAVNPKDIGTVQVRYLYQLLHGDEVDQQIVLEPAFVHREMLTEQTITMGDLSEYVEGWGTSRQGYATWMQELESAK